MGRSVSESWAVVLMSLPVSIGEDSAGRVPVEGHVLVRDVESRLSRSGYLALRDLDCEVVGGMVLLRGRVPSYYLKQLAQTVVGEVQGIGGVFNMIEVG